MRFFIDDLEVLFPFDYIYPEQLAYMRSLKQTLGNGHAVLEMPTGTGKTITLLSLLLSYQYKFPEVGKIIYCTRTVHEMNKVLSELKVLSAYREQVIAADQQAFERAYPDVAKKAVDILLSVGVSAQQQYQDRLHERLSTDQAYKEPVQRTHGVESPNAKQEAHQPSPSTDNQLSAGQLMSTLQASTARAESRPDLIDNVLVDIGVIGKKAVSIDDEESFPGANSSSSLGGGFGVKRKRPRDDTVKSEVSVPASTSGEVSSSAPAYSGAATSRTRTNEATPLAPSSNLGNSSIDTAPSVTQTTSVTVANTKGVKPEDISPGNIGFELPEDAYTSSALRSHIVTQSINTLVNMGIDEVLAIEAVGIFRSPSVLGVCLSSRRNMCIHDVVGQFTHKEKVDAMCRSKTSGYVRDRVLRKIEADQKQGTQTISQRSSAAQKDYILSNAYQATAMMADDDDDDDALPPLQPTDQPAEQESLQPPNGNAPPSSSTTSYEQKEPTSAGLPCSTCKHASDHTNPSEGGSQTLHHQEVVMDIESIGQEGLCPFYEGFISITGNKRSSYRHFQSQQHLQQQRLQASDDEHDDGSTPNITLRVVGSRDEMNNSSHAAQSTSVEPGKLPTSGVFTIDDLTQFGRQHLVCPYYLTRNLMETAHVVVFNYNYLIDPKINAIVSKSIEKESVVVFDEAHNIDNICIEVYSIAISKNDVYAASRVLTRLRNLVQTVEDSSAKQLQSEYQKIMNGLLSSLNDPRSVPEAVREEMNELLASPLPDVFTQDTAGNLLPGGNLTEEMLRKTLPGSIRRGRNFVLFLKTLVEFLKTRLLKTAFTQHTTEGFLREFQHEVLFHDISACKYSYARLSLLINTLEIMDLEDYIPLLKITSFITLISTFKEGFVVLFEPVDDNGVPDPRLQLCCVDPSLAMKPLFEKFSSVIITSGTMSPLDMYPRMLNFTPYVSESFSMSLNRRIVLPLIVAKGSDLTDISTSYADREKSSILSSYGNMIISLAKTVPDGMVVFFTSYAYMEHALTSWHQDARGPKGKQSTVIQELLKHKLIFVETKDIEETTIALAAYKKACSNGRGAIFFSIARGKVSEGIDFSGHLGRCVVLIGVPYQYTRSRVLLARLEYLRTHLNIPEEDFLHFDALRQTAQCLGRIVRSKSDYGVMILADKRYSRVDVRHKLPRWIQNFIDIENHSLSIESAIASVRHFFRSMSVPYNTKFDYGTILLNQYEAAEHLKLLESTSTNVNTQNSTSTALVTTTSAAKGDGSTAVAQLAYRHQRTGA